MERHAPTSIFPPVDNTLQKQANPINTLPPELLSLIFGYLPERPGVDGAPTRDPATAFQIWNPTILDTNVSLVLTQVCRYWRDVCLQSSVLWSHVVDSPESINLPPEVIIERSREQPLKVLLTSTKPRLASMLSEHGHRIQELHWISLDLQRNDHLLSFPAPSLRTLTLTGPRAPPSYEYPNSPPDDSHLPTLFSNHIPRLERLSLSDLTWFPLTGLGSLTHLYLDSCRGPKLTSRLLTLLGNTPHLEHLVLSALPDLALAHPRTTEAPIALTALRTLVLNSLSADSCAALLAHLSLPLSAALRIADIFPCAASLPSALAGLPPVRAATRLALDLTRAQPSVCAVGGAAGVRVHGYTSWFHYEFWLGAAQHIVSQAQIKELWVTAGGRIDVKHGAALCDLVGALPELELLVVDDAVVELMGSMRGGKPFPACPCLMSVHVLCEGRLDASAIVDALIVHEAQLTSRHVRVCCSPGFLFMADDWRELDQRFHSVEYEAYEHTPKMAMPESCNNPGHILWPSWRGEDRG
ncbi:hypothetical protein FOMPIDRAFT_1050418 [Fomitopsis schrenkii]|uniref:Uncharacterized protein n=1 Tax=Fomitopsis schrenkii TaxID=2126942 RepID=S8E3A2_FOMSC|nr:hypothetical protein FOMPIDRAFT_1050418 [Fomitopsis schrenkii]